ncbi:MAG: cobalt-precorrin-6A reductase [Pseudomonadota bacterium]
MKILLLAGTGEANQLARVLVAAGHDVTASLAGATRAPRDLGCETRIGGFGGDDGFCEWLDTHQPDLVLDATHPFAARISRRSARICATRRLDYLQLLRPPWVPDGTKQQYEVADVAAARQSVRKGARVFLATGRQTLMEFSDFQDCELICRQIDPPDGPFPFENGRYLIGRPPFTVEDEKALFALLGIDVLIVKNAGGAASYSKIEAAADLKIPVIMLKRPDQPDAPRVSSVDDVIAWIAAHADH